MERLTEKHFGAKGQFTGLIDKNGQRIFEGDIVSCPFGKARYNAQVVFCKGEFLLQHKDTDSGYWQTRIADASVLEIIGNIHDNPELLEGGNGNA